MKHSQLLEGLIHLESGREPGIAEKEQQKQRHEKCSSSLKRCRTPAALCQSLPSLGRACQQLCFKYPRLGSWPSTVSSSLGQTQGSHYLEIPEEPGVDSTSSIWNCLYFFARNSGRILERDPWAREAYLSHHLPCGWSVRSIQDLPNKQRLESFPYDAGQRTGLQILHQIIAIRSYEEDERQILTCMVRYL